MPRVGAGARADRRDRDHARPRRPSRRHRRAREEARLHRRRAGRARRLAAGQAGPRERPRPEQGRHRRGRRRQVHAHERAPLELEQRPRVHGRAVRDRRRRSRTGRSSTSPATRACSATCSSSAGSTRPDVAILPIGDHYTMDPKEAALALEFLGDEALRPLPLRHLPAARRALPRSCASSRRMSRSRSWSRASRSPYEGALVGRKRPARAGARGRGRSRACRPTRRSSSTVVDDLQGIAAAFEAGTPVVVRAATPRGRARRARAARGGVRSSCPRSAATCSGST